MGGVASVVSDGGDVGLSMCVELGVHDGALPVKGVDEHADCSLIFPALRRGGALSAGITTGGTSPTAAAWARDRLDEALPQGMESMLDWLGARRGEIKRRVPDITRRSGLFARLFALCRSLGRAPAEAECAACTEAEDERETRKGTSQRRGLGGWRREHVGRRRAKVRLRPPAV